MFNILISQIGGQFSIPSPHASKVITAAAQLGYTNAVRKLVECGMNPSLRNDNQYTALHIFAHMGDAPMVRFFLGHGAEIDARDRDSCTPLHWAAWAGKLEPTKALLKGNADVNAKDRRDRTALFGAAGGGYAEVVEFYCLITPTGQFGGAPTSKLHWRELSIEIVQQ